MIIATRFWYVVLLSTVAVHVSGFNRADFSASLEKAVVDMLGSEQYKVTMNDSAYSSHLKSNDLEIMSRETIDKIIWTKYVRMHVDVSRMSSYSPSLLVFLPDSRQNTHQYLHSAASFRFLYVYS